MSDDARPIGSHYQDSIEEWEPDARFTYANERTFLAWNRTALALMATGVAATQSIPEVISFPTRRSKGFVSILFKSSAKISRSPARFLYQLLFPTCMKKSAPASTPIPDSLAIAIDRSIRKYG